VRRVSYRASKAPSQRAGSVPDSRGALSQGQLTPQAPEKADQEGGGHNEDGPPSKRRRLSGAAAGITDPNVQSEAPREEHTHFARARRSTSQVLAIVKEQATLGGDEEEDEAAEDDPVPSRAQPKRTAISVSQTSVNEDDAVPGKAATKRKKRKSIGQQSLRKKKRPSSTSIGNSFVEPANARESPASPDTAEQIMQRLGLAAEQTSQRRSPSVQQQSEEIPERKKRKKRKKSVLLPRRRRSSGQALPYGRRNATPTIAEESGLEQDEAGETHRETQEDEIMSMPESETVLSDDTPEAVVNSDTASRKRRKRASSQGLEAPELPSIERDDDDMDEYIDDESPEPPTPAPPKKRRKRSSNTSDRPEAHVERRFSRLGFPILTHRHTNISALPMIAEEGEVEGESEDEINTITSYFPDRAAPNAVDVFAQICRESISAVTERLHAASREQNGRAEARRKREALAAFSAELEGRLFDMSAAVENRLTLESRLRKSKRDKAELQARWIELRRQREEVALECDDVRRRHWENEHENTQKWEVSQLAEQVEVQRDRERPQEQSLEYLLRSVAPGTSNASDGGGLLENIKDFNGKLERLASMLEGREPAP